MTKAQLIAKARLHESLAKLGNPGRDGVRVSIRADSGDWLEIDSQKHRAFAKQLREQAKRLK